MKRLLPTALLFSLLVAVAHAEPMKVRIQTRDKKIHIGTVIKRASGFIVFQKTGAPDTVRVPDAQIAYIQLPVKDSDEEKIIRLFDEGEYRQVAEVLNELLPKFEPYVQLPSNLTHKFMRWMVASYWTGDYERVESLASALSRFSNEEFKHNIRFYRGLAQLETGDFRAMEAFLKLPEADKTYPPESAARLYVDARILQKQKKYIPAIRTAALLMALHSRDADWMPKAELLCAELYFELDMPESAHAVLADIDGFYTNPLITKKAAAIAAKK